MMKVELKVMYEHGDDILARLYFDGVRVGRIQCTRKQYESFKLGIAAGMVLSHFDEVVVK